MLENSSLLRPLWRRVFGRAWVLNLVLFVLLGCLRAYGILGPEREGVRQLIMTGFLLMWFLPFVFWSRDGRRVMGLKRVDHPIWLLWGVLLGAAAALVIFVIGFLLYGRTADNWYVAISRQYMLGDLVSQLSLTMLIPMFTIPAMVFSPIGEEFFFRGMVHESINGRWGERAATLVNGLAFSAVHFLHYGIARDAGVWHVRIVPGMLWVLLMMGTSWLFTLCRRRGGAIWPAVLSHSAFNLVMNLTIFLVLLVGRL
jgi:membrane protease YdiL (CAAX protease family)